MKNPHPCDAAFCQNSLTTCYVDSTYIYIAFSALTLLIEHQEDVTKSDVAPKNFELYNLYRFVFFWLSKILKFITVEVREFFCCCLEKSGNCQGKLFSDTCKNAEKFDPQKVKADGSVFPTPL